MGFPYNFAIWLYALVVRIISPFHRKARLMIKGHKEVYRKLKEEVDPNAKYIWIHAASLGEFEQGRPIIERIKKDYPQYKILLSFFSPSGYEVQKNYELADIVCYMPFDKKRNVKRFLNAFTPGVAIFIKYEFWYNFISNLYKRDVPVYMVSAIFRPDQMFFKWYGKSLRKIFKFYKCICVQDENSRNLLKGIGVTNTVVCGDTRFDRVLQIKSEAKHLPLVEAFVSKVQGNNVKTLIAGSSWPKDEDIFIPYFNSSNIKLIIAPHEIHESHLAYIESTVKRPAIRYSQATESNVKYHDCLIIDSFGLLSSIYGYGDIAYIGGGFGVGIHNIVEAAVYGIPVIFGPNFKKFREAHQLIESGGGYPIHDYDAFRSLMDEFLQHDDVLSDAGHKAGQYVQSNAGVADRIMIVLKPELDKQLKA
ncbi:MAG: 3-deoxy-D-manno-octulosonic acid transferase [Dysgonomonas sp.]